MGTDGGGTSTRKVMSWHARRMRDPAFQIWNMPRIDFGNFIYL